jgi:DNA-binding FadR family transcriptional regulator
MIAAELRTRVAQGVLRAGDQLPSHREIAASFGVSLGSAREAISMLIGDGLVETRAGRGTFVAEARRLPSGVSAPITRKEIEELIEARELLEQQIVVMAAERSSSEQVAALRVALERMQAAASDPAAYPEADVEFHLRLAEAAGNRFLLKAMEDIRSLLRNDMALSAEAGIRRFGDLQFSVDSHRALVDAIDAGDAEDARRLLLDIMSRHHAFVLSLYALVTPSLDERTR